MRGPTDAQKPLTLLVLTMWPCVGLLQHRQKGAGVVVDAAPADVEGPFPFLAAVGDHAAAAADAGVVEQQMDLVGVLLVGDLVAKPLHLGLVGDIGDVRGDAQALRQPRCFAQPFGFRHAAAETSHIATLQPSATSWRTSSRPMPVPPPVTTAILPAKSFICRASLTQSVDEAQYRS